MIVKYLPFIAVAGVLASVGIEAIGVAGRAERANPLPAGPVVVELFTSEGCSSCPPADAWLRELAEGGAIDRVAVIALSEHVDYWNRLGWKDAFSSAAMTARQGHYARALGSQVYTPQMVVDGEVEFIGSDRQAGTTAIRHAAASKKAAVTADLAVATAVIDVRATITPGALDRLPDADVFVALTEDGLGLERRRRRKPGPAADARRRGALPAEGRPGEEREPFSVDFGHNPNRSGVVAGEVACRRSPPVARRCQDRRRVVRTGAAER